MKEIFFKSASALWSTTNAAIRYAVEKKLFTPARLKARVISVGNIQAGGAGKTPLVAQIAKEAFERGLQSCILTRGYKGQWETQGGVLSPKDRSISSRLCGDEAALLHELCPHAFIGVGSDRVRQYELVLQKSKLPIDCVILDDGFQNWKIQKDVDVVALTSAKRDQTLFRDWDQELKKADLLVWTKGEDRPHDFGKPMARVRFRLPENQNKKQGYWLVTGIADGGFASYCSSEAGYQIRRHLQFRDHADYEESEIKKILKEASEHQCRVLTTGKDWVKWRELGISRSEVIVLEPELVFEEGRDIWTQILWGR